MLFLSRAEYNRCNAYLQAINQEYSFKKIEFMKYVLDKLKLNKIPQ
jgi:hypothetical protein